MADSTPADGTDLRTPIVAVLGHVDHGKTTLLDHVRGSAVTADEAGAITQHIGATHVPLDVISEMAGGLVDPTDFDLPGLLFIDTPGHHSFSTLRSRGGALADIAILVVDVTDGFQPQTEEAIDILARTETPFVVAANKVDAVGGWRSEPNAPIQGRLDAQTDRVRSDVEEGLYEIIGDLSDAGFTADFYWRVSDFKANVGVVPCSAETGEGMPDLLAVLMGLSQRYLREAMAVDTTGPAAGTVLEVTDQQGFGTTLDAVIYDGRIDAGDRIVVGAANAPIVTEVRALLKPRPLAEIRSDDAFETVDRVVAADGVKIAAPELDDAMAGAPIRVVGDRSVEAVTAEVREELQSVAVETADHGVVIKADTLGSLEALAGSLEEAEIPIVHAEVGDVAPRDVHVADTADEAEHRSILAFGVDVLDDSRQMAADRNIDLFEHDVIYRLIEEYEEYVESIQEAQQEQIMENITRPARFQILDDHTFRQSDPAVVGVEVRGGTLRRGESIVRWDGSEPTRVGHLKSIQDEGEDVDELRTGERAAVSIDGPTVGRQIEEGDTLWVEIPEKHAKVLDGELREELPADERETLSMYLDEHRSRDPFWGK
ncbi:translation initiation factor IF-2 [Halococcoides cellulosivorans]|uniref:Probable translation initiation factor IF-2 n=1 Tax=Halococcoides cellulosivorans TaxID=1679096 RepID=A0A2R4WYH7_9EURY|nr:translation initiation factor IF-2 [Halococcoides cellulosivorans]AWB26599.1 translation initiation factor IF-2 [Halococcoides cellulosivorans]